MRKNPSSAQRPTSPRRANSRLVTLVIGFVAVIGLSACSPCEVETVTSLQATPDGIVAQVALVDDEERPHGFLLSQDGGQSWTWTSAEDLGSAGDESTVAESTVVEETQSDSESQPESSDAEADFVDQGPNNDDDNDNDNDGNGFGLDPGSPDNQGSATGTGPQFELVRESEACLSNGRCFRTIPGEEVQEQIDGRWETSFRFTDEELRRFEARDGGCVDGSSTRLFGFLVVGGNNPSAEQDDVVVVSMGSQGVLRLDGDSDEWERVRVGTLEPISTFGPRWLTVLAFSPLLALLLTPMIFRLNRTYASANRRGTAAVIHLVLSIGLLLITGLLWLITQGGREYAVMGLLPFICTLIVFAISLCIVLPRGANQSLGPPAPTGPPSPVEPPSIRG